jgi:hypothetical protein
MLLRIKGTLWIIVDHSILMKEPKTSNLYCPTVSYRSTSKNRNQNSCKLSGMCDRIKWFYEAPIVRFYYYFVSIFLLCYSSLSHVEYRHFLRCLDILRLISDFIQLCSSCRLFSIERVR